MSETKHTPGPWGLQPTSSGGAIVSRGHIGSQAFQSLQVLPLADAHLIAAAPDLLDIAMRWAALDGGAWNVTRYEHEKATLLDDTRAAIAKAEGRDA